MIATIADMAGYLRTTEANVRDALDYYAIAKTAGRSEALTLVRTRWAALDTKPRIAEWLRRQLGIA